MTFMCGTREEDDARRDDVGRAKLGDPCARAAAAACGQRLTIDSTVGLTGGES